MGTLQKGKGIFKLKDSDNCVGSFLSIDDILVILEIDSQKKIAVFEYLTKCKKITEDGFVDELDLYKEWSALMKAYGKPPLPKTSLDEYILKAIFKVTYPNLKIEQQVSIPRTRFKADFKLTLNEKVFFVEFDGPAHFSETKYGTPNNPLERSKQIEKITGIKVINWPFWIQRCSRNVKVIFGDESKGLGSLWTTNILFGDFVFDNSAEIIETITKQFNAAEDNGVGYFYVKNDIKPEHSIIEQIKKNPTKENRLLPKGFKKKSFWLP